MLKEKPICHQVAIAGKVTNSVTGKAISGAMVKIIDAPDAFIEPLIVRAKLLVSQNLVIQPPSLNSSVSSLNGNYPKKLQGFLISLNKSESELSSVDKIKAFQDVINDTNLENKYKFKAFQEVLDHLPSNQINSVPQAGRTRTAPDGWFYFIDLPQGNYQLETCLPGAERRYKSIKSSLIEVKQDNDGNVTRSVENLPNNFKVELKLQPTIIRGKVTDSNGQVIGMAKVQIQGTGEYTFSFGEITKDQESEESAWNYQFVGIEASEQSVKLIVFAPGYSSNKKGIKLELGKVKKIDFQLSVKEKTLPK